MCSFTLPDILERHETAYCGLHLRSRCHFDLGRCIGYWSFEEKTFVNQSKM